METGADWLYEKVRRLVWRLGVPRAHQDDIIQETVLNLWCCRERWEGRSAPEQNAFFKTAIQWERNKQWNRRREEERRQENYLREDNLSYEGASHTGEIAFLPFRTEEAVGHKLFVRKLVQEVPPREKQLITLVYYDGFSRAEAARHIGITPANARKILSRCFEGLRNHGKKIGISGRQKK